MAFLNNAGLERVWCHITNKFKELVGDTPVVDQIANATVTMTLDELDAICGATIYTSEEVEL